MSKVFGVIRRPIVTERTTALQSQNKVVFEVNLDSTKHEIRDAVERLFKVKVTDVNTAVIPGKWKRFGRTLGKRSTWKKAVVTLRAGDVIELRADAAETDEESA